MRWGHWLGRLGVGRLVYQLWFRPRAAWASAQRRGGLRAQAALLRAEARMANAAARLRPSASTDRFAIELWYLTGRRFWYQSALCAWSLQAASGRPVRPHFLDDGTLPARAREALSTLFPLALHHSRDACLQRLNARLPAARFPHLHALWHSYPNIRKLIDPHLLEGNWKLVLDSDMLFFARPDELLDWHDAPQQPLHMVDAVDSYGYPAAALEALSGARLPSRVNVGVTGLDSRALDFAEIEDWCGRLFAQHGRHYFLEQALIAAWMGRSGAQALPAARYRLLSRSEERCGQGCMDHYVADAKPEYFHRAWQACLKQWQARP